MAVFIQYLTLLLKRSINWAKIDRCQLYEGHFRKRWLFYFSTLHFSLLYKFIYLYIFIYIYIVHFDINIFIFRWEALPNRCLKSVGGSKHV